MVSGASSGIGAATACVLAAAGATVALVARRPASLARVAAGIAANGGAAVCLAADLADDGSPEDVVARVVGELGRIDVLVNNAGAALVGPVLGADPAEWSRMVDLNLAAVLGLSRAALPHLLAAAEGPRGVADLVTVASIAGRRPQAGAAVYAATKAATQAFSESLRQEVATRQVRVGLVSPGAVHTEAAVVANARAGRTDTAYLDVEDLAGAIEFMVTRPAGMAVNEVVVRPTQQVG
ncbi:SDR family NAD(P)-dependent oxidoreductase [Nocardioides panacihumi]|uniref:SDR family NAD(P)-dependent oxidoreductase n=1 Tax=Nocardioides panacihumi TaxID=400774 RepID=A0ABP5BNQ5_9ACTN